MAANIAAAPCFAQLSANSKVMEGTHLRELLKDDRRNAAMSTESFGVILDYCRQKADPTTMKLLMQLAKETKLQDKIKAMFAGEKINQTEDRAVLHVALRSPPDAKIIVDGKNVMPDVHNVLGRIKKFASAVRRGEWTGFTGKPLKDVVCIGIGGSYLGPEFVYEAVRTEPAGLEACQGRRLRFLANVDPIDVKRALEGLHPETTLVVIVSKTFTTAETMLNARTLKDWLLATLKNESAISKHMVAVSTNLAETNAFGINPDNVFGFWDWVGGRFSVTSAVGVLPLALHFGWPIVQKFLDGAHAMDQHFLTAPLEHNIPVLMGLLGIWNSTFLGHECCAILPYCQALLRFAAHMQQVSMESNGKAVTMDGSQLPHQAGEVIFGEPGTNGQHSFYQLLHQGRVVPAEFIGFCKSQNPVNLSGETVSNHDELMSNFFAQPDALALGKTAQEVAAGGTKGFLVSHKTFPGDRPSVSLLLPECNAFYVGVLLSMYEHKYATQGFVWNINSFDQWGVELGKVLAKEVRTYLATKRRGHQPDEDKIPAPTRTMLAAYLARSG
eukprot:GDKI01023592.1.p1 GENE.GDKI01023592.1~~GDKI01023592.1.p1  ORF type:complete len:556 (-),score=224.41 GDKI01023592.1:297-1964(-)